MRIFSKNLAVTILAWFALRLFAIGQSHHTGYGAIPYHNQSGSGVAFRLWAPHATAVSVAGDFNQWSTSAPRRD